jgi:hypothetical protein
VPLLLLLCAVVAACAVEAPEAVARASAGASFRVFEKGALIGSVETSVAATDEGWRIQGSSRIEGAVPVIIPNLDLHYDKSWNGRFMTMEMTAPDDAIVHVAIVGTVTRTDIVRSTQVRFQSHSVSPDTIFLPERAFGAYEAVAARLAGAVAGTDLPLFIVPVGETRGVVDALTEERVTTTAGTIVATRYSLTEIRERPTRVDIWVDRGRLLRLDLPRSDISVVRSDVVP